MKELAAYHSAASRVHALDIRTVARALGGNVIGPDKVAAPGPGHSGRDRSLVVTLSADAPDGFVCFSHAGDPWDICKDHVRQQLGLPQWHWPKAVGHAPAWALGSAGMIAHFPVIDGVNMLRILGETGTASAQAIEHCGQRWHRAGRKVQVVMPDAGNDLNDQLMAAAS